MMKKRAVFPWIWVLGVVVASFLILWPLFHGGFYVSDDGEWMVIRLSAFYQSLVSGQFPVRFLGRLNNSYGYPVANFLYPGFLYFGSFVHLLTGFSFPDSVKFILGLSVAGSAIFILFALRRRFSQLASFMGSVSFLYAPYLAYDLYHRGSVGEVLALLPASALMFAVSTGAYWLIPPGVALLIVAHNTTALLFGASFVAILFSQPRPFRYAAHMLLGAGVAAFFWAPALFESSLVRFDSVTVSDPAQYFVSLQQAILLGIPTILSVALVLSLRNKRRAFDSILIVLIGISYVMATPISAFLWKLPILVKIVQFPYRFLTIPVILGPWVIARAMEGFTSWKRNLLLVAFVVLWIVPVVLQEQSIAFVNRPLGYYTTNEGTTTVANEYMPRWVSEIPKQRSLAMVDVVSGDVNLPTRTFQQETLNAAVEVKEAGIVQINKIYYPGWGVTIDGIRVPIDYQNSFGLMRISVPPGIHEIHASFRETPERFIADVVSVVSAICYLVFIRRLTKSA